MTYGTKDQEGSIQTKGRVGWDSTFSDSPTDDESRNTPVVDPYTQWDPLDNGKAGPTRMRIFWLCALPGFILPLCGSLFLPAMPNIFAEFNEDNDLVKTLTLSIYSLLSGIFPLIWGPISDKYSRKWVLVFNLVLYTLISYLNAWNFTIWGMIVVRSLVAIPISSFFVVITGILSDIFREKERAFWLGVRNIPGFAAVLFAPPIGGVMVYLWGWRSTVVFQAILGTFSTLLILYKLPETHNKTEISRSQSTNPMLPIKIMLQPKILPTALVQGLGFAAMYLSVAAIPLTFPVYYDAGYVVIGLALVPFALGCAVGGVIGGITTNIAKRKYGTAGSLVSSLFWNFLCLPAFIGWGFTIDLNVWFPIIFTTVVGTLRTATTAPILMYCIEQNPNSSSAVNAGLLAIQFIFGGIILSFFPPLALAGYVSWGFLMLSLSILELLCFIPIIYVTYRAFKENPVVSEEEHPVLEGGQVPSTDSLSNFRLSSALDTAIGYLSDGSEFVR